MRAWPIISARTRISVLSAALPLLLVGVVVDVTQTVAVAVAVAFAVYARVASSPQALHEPWILRDPPRLDGNPRHCRHRHRNRRGYLLPYCVTSSSPLLLSKTKAITTRMCAIIIPPDATAAWWRGRGWCCVCSSAYVKPFTLVCILATAEKALAFVAVFGQ